MAKLQTNYEKHKDELINLISKGALCFNCFAQTLCKHKAESSKIDVSKDEPPCEEAWKEWCNSTK